MKSAKRDTRRMILEAGREIACSGGVAQLTFDAIAARLGISKQAVIYWFPNKEDLIAGIALPYLNQETETATRALEGAADAADAIERFVRTLCAFHLSDLDRFRLVYLSPQAGALRPRGDWTERVARQIHPVTGAMYAALERQLAADAVFGRRVDPRRAAVVIHMAVLGHVLLFALADAIVDPLAHEPEDLVDTLVALLAPGHAAV